MRSHIGLCAIHGAALWVAMTAGCTSAPGRLDAPRSAVGVPIAPFASFEECIALEQGERVDYRFSAQPPVAFNVHFHEGSAVIMPISRDDATSDEGDFTADRQQVYCLMWEAGAQGSILEYRIGPWPPHR